MQAADEERRKVERNLHDGVQQLLIAIKIRLDMAADRATVGDAAHEQLVTVTGDVQGVIDESAQWHTASIHRC